VTAMIGEERTTLGERLTTLEERLVEVTHQREMMRLALEAATKEQGLEKERADSNFTEYDRLGKENLELESELGLARQQAESNWNSMIAVTTDRDRFAKQVVDVKAEMALVQQARNEYSDALEAMTHERNGLRTSLARFKDEVRDAAIKVQSGHDHHISINELNGWLEDLGMEPVLRKYEVSVTVFGHQDVVVEIEAADEESARAQIDDDYSLAWDLARYHAWEQTDEGQEISEVSEA